MGYGATALIIYFAFILVFSVAIPYSVLATEDLTESAEQYVGNYTGQTSTGIYENIIGELIAPALIGAAAVVVTSIFLTGVSAMVLAAAILGFFTNFVLLPLSLLRGVHYMLPEPFNWGLYSFLTLLWMIAMFSFIRGKDL